VSPRRASLLLLALAACTSPPPPSACTADGYPIDDGLATDCPPGPGMIAYAFTPQATSTPALFLVKPNNTCHRRLTGDGAFYGSPSFFPGGRKLAYASTRSGLNSLYVLDLTSGMETSVPTPYDFGAGSLGLQTLAAAAPSVSPDGLTIAFEGSLPSYPGWSDVFTVPVAGGNVIRLTSSYGSTVPAWAPGGTPVYYLGYDTGAAELYATPPDGSLAAARLTSGSGLSSKFAVSGDGASLRYARFSSTAAGTKPTELVAFDLASGAIRVISSANEADPAIDATDAWVAVSRRSDSGYDLFLLDDATGAALQQLTACPGQAFGAAVARP
jgi:Tol biopolymer transport system component